MPQIWCGIFLRTMQKGNRKKQFIVGLLFTFGVVIFVALVFLGINFKKKSDFNNRVLKCNLEPTEFRFSCYRSSIEKYFGKNPSKFLATLDKDKSLRFENSFKTSGNISYAVFGTNCHTFYHAVGDYVATYWGNRDLATLINLGPTNCTNGYTMGLYKRIGLSKHFDTNLLSRFFKLCREGVQNQCAHEIGHLLHDKNTFSVLKTIDMISRDQYGLSYPKDYQYTVATETDINAPFELCRQIIPDENKVAQCFTGIGHNLFLFSEFSHNDYKDEFSQCAKINIENRENCYGFLVYRIGINEAAPRFLSNDFEGGRQICDQVAAVVSSLDLKKHCYLGLGGGIGLYVDSEYPDSLIAEIGDKGFEALRSQLADYARLCDKAEQEFADRCLAGLFGTRYKKLYDQVKVYNERIEELRPTWDSDFEVVG